MLQGWPSIKCDADLEALAAKQSELSMYILWESHVVIPSQGRDDVIHEGHPRMSKMRCAHQCDEVQSSPPPAPLHPWRWPTLPWARLHIDYARPFEGKMLLVVIGAHS